MHARPVRYALVIGHRGYVADPLAPEIEPSGKLAVAVFEGLAIPSPLRHGV
jgi:hypothetical protein